MTNYIFFILVCPAKHFQNVLSIQACQQCQFQYKIDVDIKHLHSF